LTFMPTLSNQLLTNMATFWSSGKLLVISDMLLAIAAAVISFPCPAWQYQANFWLTTVSSGSHTRSQASSDSESPWDRLQHCTKTGAWSNAVITQICQFMCRFCSSLHRPSDAERHLNDISSSGHDTES
ncbi:hypothetical protein GGF40_003007, partial [Coemansia sp. RSA 1286]